MSLLSGIDEIYVCVESLADDIWEAEDDKTGFFSVGVDSFESVIFENEQFCSPWCKIVLKFKIL